VKLADMRSDSWVQLVFAIQRGEHPDHRLLAAALCRGEKVPREAQAYLAGIVEKAPSLRGRGRPRGSKIKGRGIFWEDLLLDERDVLIATLKEQRFAKAAQVANERLEKKYRLGPDTLEKHWRNAARRQDWANADLALRIHEDRDLLAREAVNNPLKAAKKRAADELGVSPGVVEQRYRRGKAFIKSLLDDPSEFK
jgi:hypothetical protein